MTAKTDEGKASGRADAAGERTRRASGPAEPAARARGEDFVPVRRASVSRQVTEQIRRRIFQGTLRPGDRIPSERELSGQVGSNRNTVREAIRTLEELNLVHVRQGNGMVVRDFRREGELTLLPFFLAEGADAMEAMRALGDILRLRRLVLAEAAALAAERAAPEDVARLRAAADAAGATGTEAWRDDLSLFQALVAASRSLVAIWIFNTFARAFTGVMERLPGLWVQQPGRRETVERLVRAVERHRPEEARTVLDRYFEGVDRAVLGRGSADGPAGRAPRAGAKRR
ncbi:MAG: FadR family transcriptional regulator [Deltaproteobacteria bacterium]|nr:FadR family transcriptional regulator [Deltaproteobacteria bacterium]